MALGAVVGATMVVAAAAIFLLAAAPGVRREPRHRTLTLSSGRTVEVTALYLAFGDEHSQRGAVDDGMGIQYVSGAAGEARDKEAAEVFEASRGPVDLQCLAPGLAHAVELGRGRDSAIARRETTACLSVGMVHPAPIDRHR